MWAPEMPVVDAPKMPLAVFKRGDHRVMFIVRGRNGFKRIAHSKDLEFQEFFFNVHKQLMTTEPIEKFRFQYHDILIEPENTPRDFGIDNTAVIFLEIEVDDGYALYTFQNDYVHDSCDPRMPGAYRYN